MLPLKSCKLSYLCALLCHFGIFLVLGISPAKSAVQDGLLSYWPLDGSAAGTTPDAGFTNNLKLIGNFSTVLGEIGNAFAFDGLSTYLTNLHSANNAATGLPIYSA